jgi:putative holliday junction resolvase
MRHIGIDFGTKRIGVALSDVSGMMAFPWGVVPNNQKALDVLAKLMVDEKVGCVVVGDAAAQGGRANTIAGDLEAFIKALETKTGVTVARTREAWSSKEAMRFAPKGKEHDDSSAAAIILQRYLDIHPSGVK